MSSKGKYDPSGGIPGVATAALALAVLALVPAAGAAPTVVNGCTTVDTPGGYVLGGNVTNATAATCIEVTASDVVFDGRGHGIERTDGVGTAGVRVAGGANVTVRNLTVVGWETGLLADGTGDLRLERVRAARGVTGLRLNATSNASLAGVAAVTTRGNGIVLEGTTGTTGTGLSARDDGGDGLRVVDANGTALADVRVRDNGGSGVSVNGTTDLLVRNLTAVGNAVGVEDDGTVGSRYDGGLVRANGDGVVVRGATDATLANLTVRNNTNWDVSVEGGPRATGRNLTVGPPATATTLSMRAREVAVAGVVGPPALPSGTGSTGQYLRATNTTGTGSLNLTVAYTDPAVAGLDETSLRLYRHDGSWSQVASGVDVTANTVAANVTGLAGDPVLAPLGDVDPTAITTCPFTVTAPGTYTVETDLLDRSARYCIEVNASDVTVEGNGHRLDSDGSTFAGPSAGVYVHGEPGAPLSNVTVRNLTVTDWDHGVRYVRVEEGRLENVTATDNGDYGIRLTAVDRSVLANLTATGNAFNGLKLRSGSTGNRLAGANLSANGDTGLAVEFGSDDNVIRDVTASHNDRNGVVLYDVTNDTLTDVVAADNGEWDVLVAGGAAGNPATNLSVGPSTAPATTLSFDARGVRLRGTDAPPAPPATREAIGRYVTAESTAGDAYLDLALDYEPADVAGVAEPSLRLWAHDGAWAQVPGSTVDVAGDSVAANVTAFGGTTVLGALGNSTVTTIDDCVNVTSPGRYTLTTDLLDRPERVCIDVRASDVILDGGGHVLDSDGGSHSGYLFPTGVRVRGSSLSNVTVRNLTVTDWERGIGTRNLAGGRVENVIANATKEGIVLQASRNVTVTDVRVNDSTFGIRLSNTSEPTVTDVAVTGGDWGVLTSPLYPIVPAANTTNATIANVSVNGSDEAGIYLSYAEDAVVRDSRVRGGFRGMATSGLASGNAFHNVTIADAWFGLRADGASGAHTTVTGATITNSSYYDLYVDYFGTMRATNVTLDSATVSFRARGVRVDAATPPAPDPSGERNVSQFVRTREIGGPAFLDLNVSYTHANLTAAGVDEPTLRLWAHVGGWFEHPAPNEVYPGSNRVRSNLTFGNYTEVVVAPMGDNSTTTPSPGPTLVDDCVTIDSPGSYRLTTDLVDRPEQVCIRINASDVTLDGAGHTVDGDGQICSSPCGIASRAVYVRNGSASPFAAGGSLSNVTVRNLTATDWGYGVWYVDVRGGTVEGVTADAVGGLEGITAWRVTDLAVRNVTVANHTVGVAIVDSEDVVVDGLDAEDTFSPAGSWMVFPDGNGLRIDNSTGVVATDVDVDLPIDAAYTAAVGIEVDDARNVTVADASVRGGAVGVGVSGSENVSFREIDAVPATFTALDVRDSRAVTFRDATVGVSDQVSGNGALYPTDDRIALRASPDVRIVNVTDANATAELGTGQGTTKWSLVARNGTTNLTVREYRPGGTLAPVTVDLAGTDPKVRSVPSPPADPAGKRNVSRYAAVSAPGAVLVNVSYTPTDLAAADVTEGSLDPWLHDGAWSGAVGTAGTDTADDHVYATVTPGGSTVIVAPLGNASAVPVLPPTLPGGVATPTDVDGDGLFEDTNGDGTANVLDVALLLEAFDEVPDDATGAFDFNRDGRLSILDVAALLAAV